MLLSMYALWKDGGLNAQRQERTFSFVFPALNAVPVANMIYKIIINNNNKNNNNNSKIKDININNHNDNYYYYNFYYDHYHHYDRNSD